MKADCEIAQLLEQMPGRNAPDLQLTVGSVAIVRLEGRLERAANPKPPTPNHAQQPLRRLISRDEQKPLEPKRQLVLPLLSPGLRSAFHGRRSSSLTDTAPPRERH